MDIANCQNMDINQIRRLQITDWTFFIAYVNE